MAEDAHRWVGGVRAAAHLSRSLEVALAEVGLSLPQYRLLSHLASGPERATALACRLDVRRPSVTALVDGAVARGLVERRAAHDDRRAVGHLLTAAGRRALARADEAAAGVLDGVIGSLPPSERGRVLDGLDLLGRALDHASPAPGSPPRPAQPGARR